MTDQAPAGLKPNPNKAKLLESGAAFKDSPPPAAPPAMKTFIRAAPNLDTGSTKQPMPEPFTPTAPNPAKSTAPAPGARLAREGAGPWGPGGSQTLTMRMPLPLDRAMRILAAERGVMPTRLVEDAVIEYLAANQRLPHKTAG